MPTVSLSPLVGVPVGVEVNVEVGVLVGLLKSSEIVTVASKLLKPVLASQVFVFASWMEYSGRPFSVLAGSGKFNRSAYCPVGMFAGSVIV